MALGAEWLRALCQEPAPYLSATAQKSPYKVTRYACALCPLYPRVASALPRFGDAAGGHLVAKAIAIAPSIARLVKSNNLFGGGGGIAVIVRLFINVRAARQAVRARPSSPCL